MLRELRRHRICHHFCCWSAPAIPVSEEAAETIWRALNAVSTCRLSCNIQTLFCWGRKGELYTSYHIRLISKYKDLKTKVVSWFSLAIGQNASRQLATSSENLVASPQFLVALATSESQCRALVVQTFWPWGQQLFALLKLSNPGANLFVQFFANIPHISRLGYIWF